MNLFDVVGPTKVHPAYREQRALPAEGEVRVVAKRFYTALNSVVNGDTG